MLNRRGRRDIFIVPYKKGSVSCKSLAESMGIRRLKREGADWGRTGKTIINWGCSELPPRINTTANTVINNPYAVTTAANKLLAFIQLRQEGVRTVPWTESKEAAEDWLSEGHTVYARTTLSGHSGDGIVLVKPVDEDGDMVSSVPVAPLYTKWLNSRSEYRVHVAFGEVIDVRRKAKKEGEQGNRYIRSHANGYIFKQFDEEIPYRVEAVAKEAVDALGLDFGACDVLYYRDEAYIVEVNTACGLEGSTIDRYVEAFEGVGV